MDKYHTHTYVLPTHARNGILAEQTHTFQLQGANI